MLKRQYVCYRQLKLLYQTFFFFKLTMLLRPAQINNQVPAAVTEEDGGRTSAGSSPLQRLFLPDESCVWSCELSPLQSSGAVWKSRRPSCESRGGPPVKVERPSCESRGGPSGLPVLNSPYGLCGRKTTLKLNLSQSHWVSHTEWVSHTVMASTGIGRTPPPPHAPSPFRASHYSHAHTHTHTHTRTHLASV